MRRRGRAAQSALHLVQGLLMGGADIIPGVSGGTMALIVGIYERLVGSIRALAGAAVGLARGRRARGAEQLREVEWGLLIPLGVGILTAIKLGAQVIPGLLERYPEGSRALFFGLIAGSLLVPWRRIPEARAVHLGAAVLAALAAFVLVGLPPREIVDPPLLVVFGAASVAICAMILPGISGSFLLFVMGVYSPTLRALNALDLAYIAVFGLGAALGLGAFARLLDYLLRRHHDLTMAALVGLMAGSLRALWPYQDADRRLLAPPADGAPLHMLGLALLGFAAVTLLVAIGAASHRRRGGEDAHG